MGRASRLPGLSGVQRRVGAAEMILDEDHPQEQASCAYLPKSPQAPSYIRRLRHLDGILREEGS